MSIQIKKMCRGQGAAYLSVEVSDCGVPDFSAVSETGQQLPLEVYEMEAAGRNKRYVLVTPLLDTKKLIVRGKSANGDICFKKSMSRERIKWSSRLFYRFGWEEAHRMRDIDRNTYTNQIHINPRVVIPSSRDNSLIVKGVICGPDSSYHYELDLLDGCGNLVSDFSAIFQGGSEVLYNGVRRNEESFSARIPNDGNTYCLVARGEGCKVGFLCFDAPSKALYLETCSSAWFRHAVGGGWQQEIGSRTKLLEFANPGDYAVAEGPKFSIVVPLYNTPLDLFNEMLSSVISQYYFNWELILVNSTPDNVNLREALAKIDDSRVRILMLDANLGIAGNTNKGVEAAEGDYVVFFDHDDLLDPRVLSEYAKRIEANSSIDVLYCDEDVLNESGEFINPHFKSDFNFDLLRVHNYITHLLAVKREIATQNPLRKKFDGAQDYDFVLRLADAGCRFEHVPEILYHWRMSDTSTVKNSGSKPYAEEAGRLALEEHLVRCGLKGSVSSSDVPFLYKTKYEVKGSPLVSIIIPNKDSVEVLTRCIDSIESKSSYRNFEILLVENNSTDQATFDYYERVQTQYDNVRVLIWQDDFNYSKINNFGVTHAKGEYFLLLNNDTEVITPNWIESMLGFCQRGDVGAVGVKLLYPDDTIQHAGVAMMYCASPVEMGGPVHVFSNLDKDDPGYMFRASVSQDVNIVTAACLMTSKAAFERVGGLSEEYAVAYNDVDFCLKLRAAGFLVVYDADAVLYHYESFSRGSDVADTAKKTRFMSEQGKLRAAWPEYYAKGDGYYTKFVTD